MSKTATTVETTITFTAFDENDAEVTLSLPARWAVCLDCFGTGEEPNAEHVCWECDGTGEVAVEIRELADPDVLAEYDAMNKAVQLEELAEIDAAWAAIA